jgi:hypothetical protein
MKFRAMESRVYPTLALTVAAGDVVDLAEDMNVTGLVKIDEVKSSEKAAPVQEGE